MDPTIVISILLALVKAEPTIAAAVEGLVAKIKGGGELTQADADALHKRLDDIGQQIQSA